MFLYNDRLSSHEGTYFDNEIYVVQKQHDAKMLNGFFEDKTGPLACKHRRESLSTRSKRLCNVFIVIYCLIYAGPPW